LNVLELHEALDAAAVSHDSQVYVQVGYNRYPVLGAWTASTEMGVVHIDIGKRADNPVNFFVVPYADTEDGEEVDGGEVHAL